MGQSGRSANITRQILPSCLHREKQRNPWPTGAVFRIELLGFISNFNAESSNLAANPEGQGALKRYFVARWATSTTLLAVPEKPNPLSSLPSIISSIISRTSSIVNMKEVNLQSRKSMVFPEQMASQLAARLQPIASFLPSSNFPGSMV